jgi:hypothetical protein
MRQLIILQRPRRRAEGEPMEIYRWFWGLLTIAVLAWYGTITVYIAYRGVFDIRQMLRELANRE